MSAFNEKAIRLTIILRGGLFSMLLPKGEVETRLGVLLLPTDLLILSKFADWAILNRVVAVDDLPVSLCAPIEVKTERFGVTKWHSILA